MGHLALSCYSGIILYTICRLPNHLQILGMSACRKSWTLVPEDIRNLEIIKNKKNPFKFNYEMYMHYFCNLTEVKKAKANYSRLLIIHLSCGAWTVKIASYSTSIRFGLGARTPDWVPAVISG